MDNSIQKDILDYDTAISKVEDKNIKKHLQILCSCLIPNGILHKFFTQDDGLIGFAWGNSRKQDQGDIIFTITEYFGVCEVAALNGLMLAEPRIRFNIGDFAKTFEACELIKKLLDR